MANKTMAAIRQVGIFLHFDFHDLRYRRNVDQIIIQKPTMKKLPTRHSWLSALPRLSQSAIVRIENEIMNRGEDCFTRSREATKGN